MSGVDGGASQPEPECFDVYELVKPELDQWAAASDIHPVEVSQASAAWPPAWRGVEPLIQ